MKRFQDYMKRKRILPRGISLFTVGAITAAMLSQTAVMTVYAVEPIAVTARSTVGTNAATAYGVWHHSEIFGILFVLGMLILLFSVFILVWIESIKDVLMGIE